MSAKKHQHNFQGTFKHWRYCVRCGLMLLKNDASRRAAKKPCDSDWTEEEQIATKSR